MKIKCIYLLDRLTPLTALDDHFDDDADEENVDDEDYVDFPREAVKRAAEP